MERRVLELVVKRELLDHPCPPGGLQFVEAGDVVATSSFGAELNAVFRTSGFSLLSDGTWTDYPWESIDTPLAPVRSMSESELRIKLRDGRIVTFQMDHFGGYFALFNIIAAWFETEGKGGWWRRIVEEGVLK